MSDVTMTRADESGRNSLTNRSPWRPSLSPGIKLQDVDGQVILLDKENQRVHQLDHIGTRILNCCDGTRTVEDIVTRLTPKFDVSRTILAADIATLLKKMRELGLLTTDEEQDFEEE